MDTITINNLKLHTRLGVPDEERASPQEVHITVDLHLDTKEAGRTDDVVKSINYDDVTNDMKEIGASEHRTIEAFAEEIASMILEKYKPESISVKIEKFILPDTDSVSVTITRS